MELIRLHNQLTYTNNSAPRSYLVFGLLCDYWNFGAHADIQLIMNMSGDGGSNLACPSCCTTCHWPFFMCELCHLSDSQCATHIECLLHTFQFHWRVDRRSSPFSWQLKLSRNKAGTKKISLKMLQNYSLSYHTGEKTFCRSENRVNL